MNPHNEQRLAAVIDRELKALPHLRAPDSLASRVMATIEQRRTLPWYRRAWQTWPMPLQAVSMLALLTVFVVLCFVSWHVVHTSAVASATSQVGGWFNLLCTVWKTVNVLVSAAGLAFKSLGSAVIIGTVVALLFGYAMCVAFGTVYARLAFAHR